MIDRGARDAAVLVDAARFRFAEKRGTALEVSVAYLPDCDARADRSLLA